MDSSKSVGAKSETPNHAFALYYILFLRPKLLDTFNKSLCPK